MADPYGNYMAGLGFMNGPALNPGSLTPEELSRLLLNKSMPQPATGGLEAAGLSMVPGSPAMQGYYGARIDLPADAVQKYLESLRGR